MRACVRLYLHGAELLLFLLEQLRLALLLTAPLRHRPAACPRVVRVLPPVICDTTTAAQRAQHVKQFSLISLKYYFKHTSLFYPNWPLYLAKQEHELMVRIMLQTSMIVLLRVLAAKARVDAVLVAVNTAWGTHLQPHPSRGSRVSRREISTLAAAAVAVFVVAAAAQTCSGNSLSRNGPCTSWDSSDSQNTQFPSSRVASIGSDMKIQHWRAVLTPSFSVNICVLLS